jgi:hypothetical protein
MPLVETRSLHRTLECCLMLDCTGTPQIVMLSKLPGRHRLPVWRAVLRRLVGELWRFGGRRISTGQKRTHHASSNTRKGVPARPPAVPHDRAAWSLHLARGVKCGFGFCRIQRCPLCSRHTKLKNVSSLFWLPKRHDVPDFFPQVEAMLLNHRQLRSIDAGRQRASENAPRTKVSRKVATVRAERVPEQIIVRFRPEDHQPGSETHSATMTERVPRSTAMDTPRKLGAPRRGTGLSAPVAPRDKICLTIFVRYQVF